MADYRIASLTKNRQRSVVQEHDTTGFITLEALMLARQDEERRQAALLTPRARSPLQNNNINNTNNNNNRLLSSHHHPYHHNNLQATSNAAAIQQRAPTHARLSQEHNNHNQNHNQHTAIVNNQTRRSFKNHNQVKFYANNNNNAQPLLSPRSASSHRRENSSPSTTDDSKTGKKMSFTNCLYKHAVDTTARDYRDGSPEKFWIDSLRSTTTDSRNKHALKKAALYQPPPVAPLDNSGLSDQSHMRLAFEMLLDQNSQGVSGTMGRRGSGNKAAADTPTPAARLKSLFTGKPDQKTLLGSPRLHKAIFRNSSRGDSGGESLNSPPLSPPEEDADVIPLHNEHPSSSPPTPDYPGLEYPPVFEPGTYSLSDASTILRGRGGGGGGGSRDHPPSNR